MPIPSGFKSKSEWNAYQRNYRKRKAKEIAQMKERLAKLEAKEGKTE